MAIPLYSNSSMFHGAHDNTFNHSTFVLKSDRIAAFDRLEKAGSASAYHSFVGRPDPGKCYPNTRVDLLEGLEQWSIGMDLPENLLDAGMDEDESIDETLQLRSLPVMWLRGGAGAGKSAVAQTFAERCEDLGHVVASFFFFSTDPTRNEANRLFATLAYQIARADPRARPHIEAVVHHDPQIFNQDLKKQFISLILAPMQRSARTTDVDGHQRQCVVIIDGLDECSGAKAQAGIVRAIFDGLHATSLDLMKTLPRFLICSRPEEPIMQVFRSPSLRNMYIPIDLSSDTHAHNDVYIFLEGKLAEIKASHPRADLIPASWPLDKDISALSDNSSGHFIYAQTIVRVLSDDPRPVTTLDAILGLRALPQRVREPFAELDELYQHILSLAREKCSTNTVLHALGFIAVGLYNSWFHHDAIGKFLGLEDGELDALLSVVSSLISVKTLSFYHRSFIDFLHDKSRAREFYISVNDVYTFVWDLCVDIASKLAAGLDLDTDLHEVAIISVGRCVDHNIEVSSGIPSKMLLGLTQQREVTPIYQQADKTQFSTLPVPWAMQCLRYWFMLTETAQNSPQLVKDANALITGILTDLFPLSSPALPIFICEKLPNGLSDHTLPVSRYSSLLVSLVHEVSNLGEIALARFERLLEDEEMGEYRLTGEIFSQACVFWTTHLTKNVNHFLPSTGTVIQNKRSLVINWSVRRQQI